MALISFISDNIYYLNISIHYLRVRNNYINYFVYYS